MRLREHLAAVPATDGWKLRHGGRDSAAVHEWSCSGNGPARRTDPPRHTPCLPATRTGWRSLRRRARHPSILASSTRRVDDQAGRWRGRLRCRARLGAAERGRWRRRGGAAGRRGQHRCCWSVGRGVGEGGILLSDGDDFPDVCGLFRPVLAVGRGVWPRASRCHAWADCRVRQSRPTRRPTHEPRSRSRG
jgi:hypothetical protein